MLELGLVGSVYDLRVTFDAVSFRSGESDWLGLQFQVLESRFRSRPTLCDYGSIVNIPESVIIIYFDYIMSILHCTGSIIDSMHECILT